VVTTGDLVDPASAEVPNTAPHKGGASGAKGALIEAAAVLLSPAVAFYLLRLRAMAPVEQPDPSIHTMYLLYPRDLYVRYAAAFLRGAWFREGTRAGFLVPARVAYELFGAVPGFFVTRYAFALVAIIPVYLLLRRLYRPGAGALGIVVILSSPVVITAWGTDYPNAAVVSYVAGALACLAMPCPDRWRRGWLAAGAALFTLAAWSHGIGAVLAITSFVCYGVVRLIRDRKHLVADTALVAGVAVVVTAVLSLASGLVLGNFDFILPSWQAYRFLSQPAEIAVWHSSNWRWAPYVAYILVPPAIVAGFVTTFARRSRAVPTPQLLVGVVAGGQFVVFVYMQFFGNLQTLEMYFFSSILWPAICIALAITLAELARPLFGHRWGQWLPACALLTVALVYEADPHVPAFGWLPYGALVGAFIVAVAGGARWLRQVPSRAPLWIGTITAIVAIAGSSLVLTVASTPNHQNLAGTIPYPKPAYAGALGGSAGAFVDQYRVTAELPVWVGAATYAGEQLLTWYPEEERDQLFGPIGIFRNPLLSSPPTLTASDRQQLGGRRPAELLVFNLTGDGFAAALHSLAPYDPTLLRATVLSAGQYHLHVWLLHLRRFPPARGV
jgi:hypothetical protein